MQFQSFVENCLAISVFVEVRKFPGFQYGADLNNLPHGICKYFDFGTWQERLPGESHLLAFMSCVLPPPTMDLYHLNNVRDSL